MSNIAIEFNNVGKQYRLGRVGTGTLSHDLNRWWQTTILRREDPYLKIGETNDRTKKGDSDYVWALRDISFQVEQGDVVGIIGKNGAGKSTLLKLLSHITSPSTGSIRYKGRIASLLEVGTGFHPELTGRENIYMNGSIMGMTKAEITRKLDEIVDFAGVERYLDTPVKRYSSGMTVRLGFAVAAFLEPEILVVDEVLTVGDAEFQKKAIGKMNDVATNGGRTVLFVSHNMSAVRALCRNGIVLKNGMIDYIGTAGECVDRYLHNNEAVICGATILERIRYTKDCVTIKNIEFNGTTSSSTIIKPGQKELKVKIEGKTKETIKTDLMVRIKNSVGVVMATLAYGHCKGIIEEISSGDFIIEKTIKLPNILCSGEYLVDIYLHRPGIEVQMSAPESVNMHVDGFLESCGRAMRVETEGFFGLELV